MISNEDFLRFLNDKSLDFSREELEQIINEELEKPEDIMDADLIECCLESLEILDETEQFFAQNNNADYSNNKHITHRFKKTAAIAAAAAILFAGIVTISASLFNLNLFNSMSELYDNHIRIHIDKNNDKADEYKLFGSMLTQKLAKNGIKPVLLPEALLTDKYLITSIDYEQTYIATTVNIQYKIKNEEGYVSIEKRDLEIAIPSYVDYLSTSEKIEKLEVAGLSVFVMEQNGTSAIAYQDRATNHFISTPLSFEKAIEFAKTIK